MHRQALLDQSLEPENQLADKAKAIDRELDQCEEAIKTWEQMRTVLEMSVIFSFTFLTTFHICVN